jgi:hypothetical protein
MFRRRDWEPESIPLARKRSTSSEPASRSNRVAERARADVPGGRPDHGRELPLKGGAFVAEKPRVWLAKFGGTEWDLSPDGI